MKIVILGDFNLNEEMKFSNTYSHKSYYDELNLAFDPMGLIQIVDFTTWSRLVNGRVCLSKAHRRHNNLMYTKRQKDIFEDRKHETTWSNACFINCIPQ